MPGPCLPLFEKIRHGFCSEQIALNPPFRGRQTDGRTIETSWFIPPLGHDCKLFISPRSSAMRRVHRISPIAVAALTLLVAAFPLAASTIAPPSSLGELARISRSVVLAEAQGARSELAGNTPVTITRFQLVQAVAGANPGRSLQVRQMGGEV